MTQSMRKITYFENILEFKENTKEQLTLKEINNWHLCRTCLVETRKDDVDLEKLSVVDVMQGSFLSIMDMLIKTTSLEIPPKEKLPLKVCKECFKKITTFYYFGLQVHKADKVLKRLANKIKFTNIPLVEEESVEKNIIPENVKSNDQENKTKTKEIDLGKSQENESFKENTIPDDNVIIELEELFDFPEDLETLEDIKNARNAEENQSNSKYLNDDMNEEVKVEENAFVIEEISNLDAEYLSDGDTDNELASEIESILEKRLMNRLESNKDDKVDNPKKVRTVKRKHIVQEVTSTYRLTQPRVKSPLLLDFTCILCEKPFEFQQDLVKHVRTEHPNSKPFKCRICHNFFSHIQSLSRHMNIHKEYVVVNKCDFCTKTFVRGDDLKRHLRTHTGERPYACELCDKSYQQINELKDHQKKHFGNSKYPCNECDNIYTSRAGLFMHKKKFHEPNAQVGPYICLYCEKSFNDKEELKGHEKKHLSTHQYQCVECDLKFQTSKIFALHQRKCPKRNINAGSKRNKRIKIDSDDD